MENTGEEPEEFGPEEDGGVLPPPAPGQRPWLHPSEAGRTRARPSRPRRRWPGLVLAVLLGAGGSAAVLHALGWRSSTTTGSPTGGAADPGVSADGAPQPASGSVTLNRSLLTRIGVAQQGMVRVEVGSGAHARWASGVVIDPGGLVLTSSTLLGGAASVTIVTSTGRSIPARVRAVDPDDLVAILTTNTSGLPFVHLDPTDPMAPGTMAVAAGAGPLATSGQGAKGSSGSATLPGASPVEGSAGAIAVGTVQSAGTPVLVGQTELLDVTTLDAPVTVHELGGVVLDGGGDVTGLIVEVTTASGNTVAEAVPASLVAADLGQFVATGRIRHGWLGVQVGTPLGSGGVGAEVLMVVPGSPASTAGLRKGEVIRSVDGIQVTSVSQLQQLIALRQPGDTVALDVSTGTVVHHRTVVLGTAPTGS